MHHFFVRPEQIDGTTIRITGPDVNHIRNVLRMRPGEEIGIRTGEDDRDFRCRIREIGAEEIDAQILWTEHSRAELPCRITLFQALPKSDKMEQIIQKAVELGVYAIVPVETKRCVVKLTEAKAAARVKRWQAISESAAKQSRRSVIPAMGPVMSFAKALEMAEESDHLLIPYELAEGMEKTREALQNIRPGQQVGIFIGPEGGFEPGEVELAKARGAVPVSLGRRILRTETAGMAVLAALMLQLEP